MANSILVFVSEDVDCVKKVHELNFHFRNSNIYTEIPFGLDMIGLSKKLREIADTIEAKSKELKDAN